MEVILIYQRKRSGDYLYPYGESKYYFSYEHHFKADDICVSLEIGGKTLKPGVTPYLISEMQLKLSLENRLRKMFLLTANELTKNDFILFVIFILFL